MLAKEDSPQIVKEIQKSLRQQLDDSSIIFTTIEPKSGHYCITGSATEIEFDEQSNHKVGLFPIQLMQQDIYWLSISLTINTTTSEIKNVSLTIYNEQKVSLFKAEWGSTESKVKHAQPHWHVNYYHPQVDDWEIDAETSYDSQNKFNIYEQISKVHFAMFAGWHLSGERKEHFNELQKLKTIEVVQWIKEVWIYIKEQLIYLRNKAAI